MRHLGTHHLTNSVETLAVETKRLLKQHPVFDGPLVREWCEVCKIRQSFINGVFVPKEHPESLEKTMNILY